MKSSLTKKSLTGSFDTYLVDLWGVIYNDSHIFSEAVNSINDLISKGKEVIFLSNNPRPGHMLREKLKTCGLNIDRAKILTSGDIVHEQLKEFKDKTFKHLGKHVFHIGRDYNPEITKNTLVSEVNSIETADFILFTDYCDDPEALNQFEEVFLKAKNLKLPLICANPDTIISKENGKRFCSGFFSAQYEKHGGTVHYYGKPHNNIFTKALNISSSPKKRTLMIGDTLETDILGASNLKIPTLLVLSGNYCHLNNEKNINKALLKLVDNPNQLPTYISPSLGSF